MRGRKYAILDGAREIRTVWADNPRDALVRAMNSIEPRLGQLRWTLWWDVAQCGELTIRAKKLETK